MRLRRDGDPWLRMITALFLAATAWAFCLSARAAGPAEGKAAEPEKEASRESRLYEIRRGDSLGSIAVAHAVRISELMDANEITDPDTIYAGQQLIIPGDGRDGVLTKRGVVMRVPKGVNLSRIAAAYGIPVRTIARANKIKNPDRLRSGQKLLIPGAKKIVKVVKPPPCYKDPVTLYRVRNGETRQVSLCYCDGRPTPEGITVLSAMSGPVRLEEPPFPLHPRLVSLLQRVADQYPGRRIEIISGQRVGRQKSNESYHTKGQALDFRVERVSNKELSRFVRKLPRTGVGYYPNSVFIHMDTRDKSGYWVDYSRPGERSIYGRADMTADAVEAIRAERRKRHTAPPAPAAEQVEDGPEVAEAPERDEAVQET